MLESKSVRCSVFDFYFRSRACCHVLPVSKAARPCRTLNCCWNLAVVVIVGVVVLVDAAVAAVVITL